MDKRYQWFDEGAQHLRSYTDRKRIELPEGDWYACPCCMTAYQRVAVEVGVLTIEDVPPKSVGGRPTLLTCKSCNNGAGSALDSHAARRQNFEDFWRRRETGHEIDMTAFAKGVPMRGVLKWRDGGIVAHSIPKRNNPRDVVEHFRILDQFAAAGSQSPDFHFRPEFGDFEFSRANLSWIRAAYLAAFSVFGWPYLWRQGMNALRELFLDPSANQLPVVINRDFEAPPDRRTILLVSRPRELECLAIAVGELTVLLPSPLRSRTFEELDAAIEPYRRGRRGTELAGKLVDWPRKPMYLLR